MRYGPLIRARVRTLLERKGMNGMQLAVLAGLGKTHVYDILSGNRLPSLEALCLLEQALGAPILTTAGRYEKRLKPRIPKDKKGRASKVKADSVEIDLDRLSSEE